MPVLGLHLVVFLTFGAALVVAAVRVAAAAGDRLLTSMLAWSGTFGLIGTVYWAGRAHTLALFDFFAPWALALVLLTLVVVRALAARGWRRPAAPELAVLFGFALLVCSLPQIPAPWSQLDRLRDRTPTPAFVQLDGERLVAQTTRPGEKVAILTALGHRVAYDVGVVNVSPYASFESMPTRKQLRLTIDVLRREGGHKLYISTRFTTPEKLAMLQREGFSIQRIDPSHTYIQLVSP